MPPNDPLGYVNPFADFLEETDFGRRVLFGGYLPNQLNRGQRQFGNQFYEDILSQYTNAVGRQVRTGAPATLRFNEFLQDNPFDLFRERRRAPLSQSGLGTAGLVAPTAFGF